MKQFSILKFILLLILLPLLSSCASVPDVPPPDPGMDAYIADKPQILKPAFSRLRSEGRRNEVLNNMRLGLAAYRAGFKDIARSALDRALQGIETVYADSESAKQARSLWYEEGMKDFKGEPYERSMAYYYRGLMYIEDGDLENARAAFKSGIIQDSFAEEEQFRCDFALLIMLEAMVSQRLGNVEIAREVYKELNKFRPDFSAPSDANVLILIESGYSPRKLADGPGHAELKYRRGRNFTENRVQLSLDGSSYKAAYPMEDIDFQASSRGGRQIDKILKDKVVFREKNLAMGSALSEAAEAAIILAPLANIGSANAMGSVQAVAGGLAVIGALQQYIAINAKPQADTRYWDNLPDMVHVALIKTTPGTHSATFRFTDEKYLQVPELAEKKVTFQAYDNKFTLVVVKSR
ncbi:MAG: hypothetical protein A2079_01370 [Geobacteraceae bacterium GWC2_48_7]|nr:MAG: hypothetical protein A2079_01370 [Geobacteraceae bacterium GWC2_48_7]